jgi:hypothetical protein
MKDLRQYELESHSNPWFNIVGRDDEWDYCFRSSPPKLSTELFRGCHRFITTTHNLDGIKWQSAKNYMRISGMVVPAVTPDEMVFIIGEHLGQLKEV